MSATNVSVNEDPLSQTPDMSKGIIISNLYCSVEIVLNISPACDSTAQCEYSVGIEMTYEYNPYTLAMYSDHNSVTENSEDRDIMEEDRDLTNSVEEHSKNSTIKTRRQQKAKRIPRLESKVRNLLQLVFNEYCYPPLELRRRLSSETGLRMEVVNMWMSVR